MIPTTSNNNNKNLQMSQSQEIEANIQSTVLNNAVAEFLQDMNSWDHINDCTQAVVPNIIREDNHHGHHHNNSSRFNIAGQDELTSFRILRSQVQLENDLGIDNSGSAFALDLRVLDRIFTLVTNSGSSSSSTDISFRVSKSDSASFFIHIVSTIKFYHRSIYGSSAHYESTLGASISL
ncbi:hypothetical protein BGZ80_009790 [Entomortierella chlamydospora]|uniref:Uncharacterized protein n=1 Tax=Entomortierella chlamydospora TaxID=101097 RepID=A0A9P6MX20_9FUNG|nr:hypothetical protein BGZ80_009790 [Entomortierella chlamydospora]